MIRSRRRLALVTLAALLSLVWTAALPARVQAAPPPLTIDAKAAVLLDFTTGQALFEQNADAAVPPASLTKLMTLHLGYKRIAAGAMKPTDKVNVTTDAWAAKMRGSSVMFLAPGQNVTVAEVMKGIAVPSGNDASIALAQHISGTVPAFVDLMNREAIDMGFQTMKFADPHGLSANNIASAREFAEFARRYIELHPDALKDLHSVEVFKYPEWENLSPVEREGTTKERHQPIVQYNRNGLLGKLAGVDGLKTGFIDESGYNIALTAQRGDMRLVALVLGVEAAGEAEGSRKREAAGAALINWGFQNFETVRPEIGTFTPVRVWKGVANQVELEAARAPVLTVPRGQGKALTRTVHQEEEVVAPVKQGAKLGELIYSADGKEVARIPLTAKAEVPQGGFFKRLWDTIKLTVLSLFKQ